MKGVILSVNPKAHIIDLTHQVDHGAILQGADLLLEAYPFFPDGTIHVAVIDPGVGSQRRPILVKTERYIFVGPDNGLFWPIMKSHREFETIHLTEKKYFMPQLSQTFHGRDVFAPVAGHLSLGLEPRELGRVAENPVSLDLLEPHEKNGILHGQVIRVDHFGNLITNIGRETFLQYVSSDSPLIRIGKLSVKGLRNTYADVREGDFVALIGSSNRLEIAVNLGRACDRLGLPQEAVVGMVVKVHRE
jgi:S-adenosylmethionine hydrolase